MKVRAGWATDFAHVKFDVEVEEQDWEQFLADEGLWPPPSPGITVMEKAGLMKAMADVIAAAGMFGHFEDAQAKYDNARRVKASRMADVRKRLGIDAGSVG